MFTGGWSSSGMVTSPRTGAVKEFWAMSDPSTGMSMAQWSARQVRRHRGRVAVRKHGKQPVVGVVAARTVLLLPVW